MKMAHFNYWKGKIKSKTMAYCSMKEYPSNIVYQMSAVCTRTSRNSGILAKLRHSTDMHLDKVYTYQKFAPILVTKNCLKAAILWDNIPSHLKDLNIFNLSNHLKLHLLSEQHSEN